MFQAMWLLLTNHSGWATLKLVNDLGSRSIYDIPYKLKHKFALSMIYFCLIEIGLFQLK